MKIYSEIASVKSNKMIADNIYEAFLYSPNISAQSKPGQFINILPSCNWNNVMRRPMSIASQSNNLISIIYKIFGEGTKLISEWKEDDNVDIIELTWTDPHNITSPLQVEGPLNVTGDTSVTTLK